MASEPKDNPSLRNSTQTPYGWTNDALARAHAREARRARNYQAFIRERMTRLSHMAHDNKRNKHN